MRNIAQQTTRQKTVEQTEPIALNQQAESIDTEPSETNSADVDQATYQPVIIAGTSNGLLFLDSRQDTQRNVELEGKPITALASSPQGLWVIVDRSSIWHRNAGGEWYKVAAVDTMRLNCILPVAETVLVGTSEAHLLRIMHSTIDRIKRFDDVKGRAEWYTPWGAPPDVRSMAASQSGELYVNVHVGGILRSQDQGQSWQPTIDFHADVHEVQTVPSHPEWVVAATAQGLATSQDKGNSWSFDRTNLHAAYARAVAICDDTILMTTSTGPHGRHAAIYRRSLEQAGTFEKCEQGLPEWFSDNIDTGTLATSGNLAAFGTWDGQIFLSEDAGLTWTQVATNLTPIHCLTIDLL